MSLGYYAETADDVAYTPGLLELLEDIAARNVTIFCSAGNDASRRKFYPAAFAPDPLFGDAEHCRLVSVAALNPDGRTIALFSNDGQWVTAQATGANLVSSVPTTARGGWSASLRTTDDARRTRSTIDPDDYFGGFATWSGTSFAAPVLAGRFLASLLEGGDTSPMEKRQDLARRLIR